MLAEYTVTHQLFIPATHADLRQSFLYSVIYLLQSDSQLTAKSLYLRHAFPLQYTSHLLSQIIPLTLRLNLQQSFLNITTQTPVIEPKPKR